MFCYKCGTKLPDDAVFCMECGSAVKTANQVSEQVSMEQAEPEVVQEIREPRDINQAILNTFTMQEQKNDVVFESLKQIEKGPVEDSKDNIATKIGEIVNMEKLGKIGEKVNMEKLRKIGEKVNVEKLGKIGEIFEDDEIPEDVTKQLSEKEQYCMDKLDIANKNLNYYFGFYMIGFALMQISVRTVMMTSSVLMTLAGVFLPMFILSYPTWRILNKYGITGTINSIFSMRGYDVYVNGVKSITRKWEYENANNIFKLILILFVVISSYISSLVVIAATSISVLVTSLHCKRKFANSIVIWNGYLKKLARKWVIFIAYFILIIILVQIYGAIVSAKL
ncbi:zinc ribbon domain-containing protein [Anaeromicropila populeti]|uniref:Zinc-ribbon domain-containing protein n=1 Tax=Anaeromicropila populeti TaxID=37658 RepID=A0A1I6K7M4_9FIRM|nr:zinc ribbon domain-containing protein [Anaeromicropila populeti]SFR87229.1 zinc-ribbon domain-containing protein [Anaeromicropila populeti]